MSRIVDTALRTTLLPARQERLRRRNRIRPVPVLSALIVTAIATGIGTMLIRQSDAVPIMAPQGLAAQAPSAAADGGGAKLAAALPGPGDQRTWTDPASVASVKAEPELPAAAPPPVIVSVAPPEPAPAPVAPQAPAPPQVTATPPEPAAEPPLARAAAAAGPSVPTNCLPAGLRNVLADVEARFGAVTLVSTTRLHTDNHRTGSVRHKLHANCKAVDFKVAAKTRGVTTYLRSRPEVAGINTYGNNGVIHIDYKEQRRIAQR
jgi:hypothetical protein